MPQVSVVIPTYNHADFILATLNSVFAQTFSDYEIIVVNDGSPDDTEKKILPFAEAGRLRYIKQANAGQAAARNRGIMEAQGEFIALLDDDDLWPADKLQWQVDVLSQNPDAVLIYGSVTSFTNEDALVEAERAHQHSTSDVMLPSGEVHRDFLMRNWIVSPGQTLIRASALKDINGFDENIWGTDDHDLYIRLAAQGKFAYEKICSLCYRRHANNASNDIKRMHRNSQRLRSKHIGPHPNLHNYLVWLGNHRFCRDGIIACTLPKIRFLLDSGDKQKARRLWLEALLVPPPLASCRYMFYLLRRML